MDTFIKLPNGQLVNKSYANERVMSGLNSGLYQEVSGDGTQVIQGEPTVLSSTNGRENFESKIQPSIDKANQNIAQTTARNAAKDAAKLNAPPAEDPLPADIQAELDGAKDPEELLFEKQMESADKRIKEATNTFSSLSTLASASAQSQIWSLTTQWNQRRGEMERANKSNIREWENTFARTGISRYSPGRAADILTAKEEEGIARMQEVDNNYNSKVAEINAALDEKQYSRAAELTKELNSLEKESLGYMKDLTTIASEENKKIKEKRIQASRDMAIADLMNQGVTDPMEIMSILSESAEASGYSSDFTADEIEKTLKSLTSAKDDWQEKLSGATRDFFILKNQGMLPGNISSLPENQQLFSYLKAEKAASSIGGGSGKTNKFTLPEIMSLRSDGLDVPLSLVGEDQDSFNASLTQTQAPAWFKEKLQGELQMTIVPEALQEAWKEYQDTEIAGLGIKPEEQSNDYEKARKYFEASYELDEDTLDQLATAVETKVNGGMSYADAIAEVIEETK